MHNIKRESPFENDSPLQDLPFSENDNSKRRRINIADFHEADDAAQIASDFDAIDDFDPDDYEKPGDEDSKTKLALSSVALIAAIVGVMLLTFAFIIAIAFLMSYLSGTASDWLLLFS